MKTSPQLEQHHHPALPPTHIAQIACYSADFPLTDPISQDLLAQLASARLRLDRAAQLEALAQQIEPSLDQLPQLAALERYRKSAEASYHRAYRLLLERLDVSNQIEAERETLALDDRQKPVQPAKAAAIKTVVYTTPKTGRNDPCPCQSGRKYKVCCLNNKRAAA